MNPSKLYYGSDIGNNQYCSRSNNLILSTDDAPSLVIQQEILKLNNQNTNDYIYNFSISNTGNLKAQNISISIMQPGILKDISNLITIQETVLGEMSNFTIQDGYLNFFFNQLEPGQIMENFTIPFTLLNNRLSSPIHTSWNYKLGTNIFSNPYVSKSNQVFLSRDKLQEGLGNYVKKPLIQAKYTTPANFTSPCPGDTFLIHINIKNNEDYPVYGISYSIPKNITGIITLNTTDEIFINEIQPMEEISYSLSYIKSEPGAYLLPPISLESTLQPDIFYFRSSSALLLGNLSLSISKTLETLDVVKNEKFKVRIILKNTGNIEFGDFIINDLFSYDAKGFTLSNGIQIKAYQCLLPGNEITLEYELKTLDKENIYTMNPAFVEYWYIFKNTIETEPILIKVRKTPITQIFPLGITLILGISGIFILYRYQIKNYNEYIDFKRREDLYFGRDFTEISWNKRNIKVFLDSQLKAYNNLQNSKNEKI